MSMGGLRAHFDIDSMVWIIDEVKLFSLDVMSPIAIKTLNVYCSFFIMTHD